MMEDTAGDCLWDQGVNERREAKAGSSPGSLGCTWWPVQSVWSLYRFLGNVLCIQLSLYVDHFLHMHFATFEGPEQKQATWDVWSSNKSHLIWSVSPSLGHDVKCASVLLLSYSSDPTRLHLCWANVHFLPHTRCCKSTTNQPEVARHSGYSPPSPHAYLSTPGFFFHHARAQIR